MHIYGLWVLIVSFTNASLHIAVEMDEDDESMPMSGIEGMEDGLTALGSGGGAGHAQTYTHTHIHGHPHETPHAISQPYADIDPGSPSPSPSPTPPGSPHVFHPPAGAHPSALFSFPTPTAYAAPPNAIATIAPCANGSTSALFRCIVKTPEVVQLEVNGELHTNAADVAAQFRAELRAYTRLPRHRNICAFLGCLDRVGMVLEHVDGVPLLDVVRRRPPPDSALQIDLHNQLLDGLAHVHTHGLSHGDLSLLNVFWTQTGTLKILDFGRSVDKNSVLVPPDAPPPGGDPTADGGYRSLARTDSEMSAATASSSASSSTSASVSSTYRAYSAYGGDDDGNLNNISGPPVKRRRRHTGMHRVEQIHPGTRPFAAPEVLRGTCEDARLADAYSFGVMLVCFAHGALVDADPNEQMRDEVPKHFLAPLYMNGSGQGGVSPSPLRERIEWYVASAEKRRRVAVQDLIAVKRWWEEEDV